jgi:hypothetical protein
MSNLENHSRIVVLAGTKSMAAALLLAFFFGPLGLLYASVGGGILMFLVSVPVMIVTLGIGAFALLPICVIWAAVAVK